MRVKQDKTTCLSKHIQEASKKERGIFGVYHRDIGANSVPHFETEN